MDNETQTLNKLVKLAPVLEDHAEWYGLVLRRLFFPGQLSQDISIHRPDTLKNWIESENSDHFFEGQLLQNLRRIHDELHEAAERLMAETSQDVKPDAKKFESLQFLYEGFITQLRRLERDVAQADSGIDPASGLRNRMTMIAELERELERRARRGRSFCLALAKIDDFEDIKNRLEEEQFKSMLAILGRLIRKCIRSFDDGYRSGDNEFIMCLKHSDSSGGTTAVNRLRSYLEMEKITIPDGMGGFYPLTMSYCVAEPMPGETLDHLMENMRSDLEAHKQGGNMAVEYHEQSALSRFIKSMPE